VYVLFGLYIIFFVVLVVAMERQGPIDPLSWESILSELCLAAVLIFVGLDFVLTPKVFLSWLRPLERYSYLRPSYATPACQIRIAGCLLLLFGSLLLINNVLDALTVLGLVPNMY